MTTGWAKKFLFHTFWHKYTEGREYSACGLFRYDTELIKKLLPEPPEGANKCPDCLRGE